MSDINTDAHLDNALARYQASRPDVDLDAVRAAEKEADAHWAEWCHTNRVGIMALHRNYTEGLKQALSDAGLDAEDADEVDGARYHEFDDFMDTVIAGAAIHNARITINKAAE